MKGRLFLTILLAAVLLWMQGCQCPADKGRAEAEGMKASPCAAPQMVTSDQTFPSQSKGMVKVEKSVPEQIIVNQPFDYRIRVQNTSSSPVKNVIVYDVYSENLQIQKSDPNFTRGDQGRTMWYIGELQPEESELINVTALTSQPGDIGSCTKVTFDDTSCMRMAVVQPQISISKSAPEQALACDRIPISYTITNEGSGYACDIQIQEELPEGLMTSEGQAQISQTIESLAPGESKTVEVMIDPTRPAEFSSQAIASSQNAGSSYSEELSIKVVKPQLTLQQTGPAKQFLGQNLRYQLSVSNQGDGPARDTVLTVMVPEGAQFHNASMGGQYQTSSPGQVTWELDTLEPGESKTVDMIISSQKEGTIEAMAVAEAYCADQVTDSVSTTLEGIPALLLEVVDQRDPIPLGGNEVYEIKVKNQGTKAAINVQVTSMIADAMEYISSTGPTTASVSDGKVTFAPLDSLAPKATATYRVTVRAASAGDQRFKTMLTSESLTSPVIETEATEFYETGEEEMEMQREQMKQEQQRQQEMQQREQQQRQQEEQRRQQEMQQREQQQRQQEQQ